MTKPDEMKKIRLCPLKIECVDCEERIWCFTDDELRVIESSKQREVGERGKGE